MITYTCIQKYTDNHGNAISYVLQDEQGRVGEFKREIIVAMLQNPNNKFNNLKLTSDGKVIFHKGEALVEERKQMDVHPSTVLAMLINNLYLNNTEFNNRFFGELNYNWAYGKERQTLNNYLDAVKVGINHESYISLISRSKDIELRGVYTNNKGKDIGYRIKNLGKFPISYTSGIYSIEGDHDDEVKVHKIENKTLNPNEEIAINRIDAVRLISQIGFGGMWKNTMLKCGEILRGAGTPDEFARWCYLDSVNQKVLKGKDRDYIMKSMGEVRDINYNAVMPNDIKQRKNSKGLFNLFKR